LEYSKEQKLLSEARDRLKLCIDEDNENRQAAYDDLRFISIEGAQWPDSIRAERESEGRPCITTNKLPTFIDQVVGDERQNRPSVKVIPVDSKADPIIADILSGWIKNVEQTSNSDTAVDHGFEHAVACGYGAMRVVTEYSTDDSFDQDVFIRKIDNALSVYWGRHSEYDCSDAQYCFVVSDISRDEYKDKYDDNPMPFNSADSQFIENWCTEDTVRVCEYFVKEPVIKTIHLLEDGRVVDKLQPGDVSIKKRKVSTYKIKWYLLSGNKVLDEKDWPGKKYIPIIPIWGKELNVGGRRVLRGLIRNAKDPQRLYNYFKSCNAELVALAPKTPYIATAKQIAGHENQWNEAHRKNYAYLLVNPDEKAPGWPHREAPPQASSAMAEQIAQADQEIRDTTGLQKASLGMQSNERSGTAIRERQREGDTGTFAFIDNLARSIAYMGRVLVDIAPAILDTERIIRLGLEDGTQRFEAINIQTETGKILNDLSLGTYDVVVTVGPSFTTQRSEARQSMQEFMQYVPQSAPLIGDLFAKNMDWPGAAEFSERLATMLPPEIKAKRDAKEAAAKGLPPTPPPQQPPDPMVMAKLEEEKLNLQLKQIEIEQEKVKLEQLQVELQLKAAESKGTMKAMIDEIIAEDKQQATQPQTIQPQPSQGQETPPPSPEEFQQFLQSPQGQAWQAQQQGQPMQSEGFEQTAIQNEMNPPEGEV
jgi:hypothetical protein